jgi:hypothetical protein
MASVQPPLGEKWTFKMTAAVFLSCDCEGVGARKRITEIRAARYFMILRVLLHLIAVHTASKKMDKRINSLKGHGSIFINIIGQKDQKLNILGEKTWGE